MAGVDQVSKLLTAGGTSALSAVSPWTLAAGLPAEAFKLGKGIADRALANKIDRRTQRPMFQIPGAAIEGLNLQRNLAAGQSPGLSQAQNLMAQSQAGNTAAILNSGGSSGERMAALMGQNQIANQGALQLGAQQENWAAAQNQNLINQLGQFEDWQQKKWNWDIQQPYEQAKAKAAELRADASQNIYGALRGIGGQAAATIKTGGEDASTLGQVTTNADGSLGPVSPAAKVADPTKDYQGILGIGDPTMPRDGDGSKTSPSIESPATPDAQKAKGPAPKINTIGAGEPIPFMGTTETGENEMPTPRRDLKTGNFDPKVYDQATGKILPKNSPNSIAAADPNARIFGMKPKFDPLKGIQDYDFAAIEAEGAKKNGVSPAAMEADKKLAERKSAFFRSNPEAVVSKYAPLFRGISKYITGGI